MKNVIAYIRVSTGKQDRDRQRNIINDYCKKKKYPIIETIEESESGAKANREGLQKLFSLPSTDNCVIVFASTSRLSREEDILTLIDKVRQLLDLGFDVLFIDGEKFYKAGTKFDLADVITLAMEAAANAKTRLNIISETQSGKKNKISKGAFVGGKVPLGFKTIYNSNPLNGKKLLAIDEKTKHIIETIFDCVANKGMTKVQTARYVDVPVGTIGTILHNKIYIGKYSYLDSVVEVPAIISDALFNKVQITLQENILMKSKGAKNYNELKGIIKCACGRNMTIQKRPDTGKLYYRCISKFDQTTDTCDNTGIKSGVIDNIVWINTKAFLNKTDFKLKTEKYTKELEIEIQRLKYNIVLQNKELEVLTTKSNNAVLLLFSNESESEKRVIQAQFSEIVKQKDAKANQITKMNDELATLTNKKQELETKVEAELLENLSEIEKAKIYKQYIESVVYYSVTRFKGFIVIIYKNGYEVILQHSSRNNKATYLLPTACTFNPVTRKVIFSTNEIDGFSIGKKVTKELDYDEVEKNFFMEEYLIQL